MTFYQPELERVLRTRLAPYPCVQTALGVELANYAETADSVDATLKRADGTLAVVRPDRTVLRDGPLEQLDRIVGESLVLPGAT